MKPVFWILSIVALLISCADGSRLDMNMDMKSEIAEAPTYDDEASQKSLGNVNISEQKTPIDRKIIWVGDLELQVDNVDRVTTKITDLCTKFDAFVSDMNLRRTNYEISNRITVKVKSKDFTNLINEIKGNSIFTRKIEITSNDVTEEFIDIETRLKTKREVRKRYIDILQNKTGDIKDVIEAEDAIRKITEEIEAKEGRLRYLSSRVNFSTVNIFIFQEVDYKNEPQIFIKPYTSKLMEALQNGWSMVTELLLIVFNIWPLMFVGGLIFWRRKWIKKRFSKGHKS